jgi:hypothetical protein
MTERVQRIRRVSAILVVVFSLMATILANADMWQPAAQPVVQANTHGSASSLLVTIPIKGRAPKTDYKRTQFGDGWATVEGCDTRNVILNRDLKNPIIGDGCKVLSGTLDDPYTGKIILFNRGADTSDDVQIDHVVALSDAWQKGAQNITSAERVKLANDPLELLAVEGKANQVKSDGDAATWLPPNKSFRCQYVARQIAVKAKYHLWMTQAEHDVIQRVLNGCPGHSLPSARA